MKDYPKLFRHLTALGESKRWMKDHPKLFRYLLAVGVCYFIAMCIYFSRVSDVLSELESAQNPFPEPDKTLLSTDTPLALGKHIDALPFATVKNRAEDMRRRYNRNVNLCKAVRKHLLELIEAGYVGNGVVNPVERSLQMLERQNALLKKQYDAVVAFAEKHYVQKLAQEHDISTEEDVRLLDKQNERLLNVVEKPLEL